MLRIYISSPLPVPGASIIGISIGSTSGGTIFGVTGLKSIALGNVGDNAAGAGTVIAPFVTIRGFILALIAKDTGFSGTVVLLANP